MAKQGTGNNLFDFFAKFISKKTVDTNSAVKENSQTTGAEFNYDSFTRMLGQVFDSSTAGSAQLGLYNIGTDKLAPLFDGKKSKIDVYRKMAQYPEIADALETYKITGIFPDSKGNISALSFDDMKMNIPANIKKKMTNIYNYVIDDLLDLSNNAETYYERFLIDSEIFIELIPNEKKDSIVGTKLLNPSLVTPIYSSVGTIDKFILFRKAIVDYTYMYNLGNYDTITEFPVSQIIYVNTGKYGNSPYDVRGYLHNSVKTYNLLNSIDDHLAIYRALRATETRVWNVYTAKMAPTAAAAHVQNMAKQIRKKDTYNYETGYFDQTARFNALTSEFFFSKDDSGQQTDVSSIGSGMDIGTMPDLSYFKEKLYTSLGIPKSRWSSDSQTSMTPKKDELQRDEYKLNRRTVAMNRNFVNIITQPMKVIMSMEGIDSKYIDSSAWRVTVNTDTNWQKIVETANWETAFETLSSATSAGVIYDPINAPSGWLSAEWFVLNVLGIPQDVFEVNKAMLKAAKASAPAQDEFGAPLENTDQFAGDSDSDSETSTSDIDKELGI